MARPVHRPDGKVKVTKTEKPVQHGAWIGLAAGARAAVVFTFPLAADEAERDALDAIGRANQHAAA